MTASNNVNVNANVTATGNTAGLVINPNTANGSQAASGSGVFNLAMGNSITLSGTNPSLAIAGHVYTVINNLGAAGSTTGTDLQGINGNLSGFYALGSNINAAATSSWNGGSGFTPLGNSTTNFTGSFNGLGHTISSLTISLPSASYVGLFGYTGAGSVIQNVGLVGGSVSGSADVGGLVGYNVATVSNSYATGGVSGYEYVGGLVGFNASSISNSYATGNVHANSVEVESSGSCGSGCTYYDYDSPSYVGGLVGYNVFPASSFAGRLSGILFADTGGTRVNVEPYSNIVNSRFLSGMGAGLAWAVGGHWSLRASYAHRLGASRSVSAPDSPDRLWIEAAAQC